jgi:alkylation response protein AidB-like acyl-CoA dehydrogenase
MTEEQRLITSTIRRFVSEQIVPLEAELDPDAFELPEDDYERLTRMTKEMGYWNLFVPAEFGGPGLSLTTLSLVAEEMSQHRAGLYAPCYHVFGTGGGLVQLYEANEEQKERYLYPLLRGEKRAFFALTEPTGGSDPARAIRTTAVRDGDWWVLNGTKTFISGADRADFGLVFARTDPGAGRGGITCFIVDTNTPGFRVRRIIHTLRSSEYPCEIEFDNCRVPHANVLGQVGQGFAIANERLTRSRVTYAAGSLGVAVAAQRMAISWAKQRETFGDLLANRQAIQWMLVDSEIEIRSSRWLILDAAGKADRGEPFRTEAAMAKLVATESAWRVVDRAMQIYGGLGVTKDLPLERWWRELRIRRIGEGPSEVQRMLIARDILSRG